MSRVRDWQSRLDAVIRERQHVPFEYGVNDCAGFAAACVEAVTGTSPLDGIEWSDDREAVRLLQTMSLREWAASRLGAEVSPRMAQPGDVGMFMEGEREALCVWGGSAWLAPGKDGLVVIRRDALVTAWRCA